MSRAAVLPQVVVRDRGELAATAAERFGQIARGAIEERGVFRVALSGGHTPRALYSYLATHPTMFDWARVQVYFSDERFVAPDSPESNYGMAMASLLSHVPVPERSVHPVPTVDITPQESAAEYEESVRRVFSLDLAAKARFDLIMLGLGSDGHTASLFPDTEALRVTDRMVCANFIPTLDSWRVTFTYPLINSAATVMFLVEGEDKAERVREVLHRNEALPATGIMPEVGACVWMLDTQAASHLEACRTY